MQAINKIAQCSCDINTVLRQSTHLQIVRFKKPRFVPKAKSKIFRVRQPTPIEPKEYEKMMKWTNIYNTQMKSIRSYLYQYTATLKEKQEKEEDTIPWEERYNRMVKLNDAWNQKTGIERLEAEQQLNQVSSIRKVKIVERDERETLEMQEKARQKVIEVKQMSSEFIAEEDLDREIEKLLNSRVSYEFALKPDGSTTDVDPATVEKEEVNVAQTEEPLDLDKEKKPPTL